MFTNASVKAVLTANGDIVQSIAAGGASINNQLASWQASAYRGSAAVGWVFVQVGVNDIAAGRTATQVSVDMAALLADIASNNPAAGIVMARMTPALGYPSFTPPAVSARYLAANVLLDAQGAKRQAFDILGGGTNVLVPSYDSGDGLHLSVAGSMVLATTLRQWTDDLIGPVCT